MKYYHSDRGFYPFQPPIIAECAVNPVRLAALHTGLGKSHIAMATAALLLEDEEIDHVLLVAEKDKLEPSEWPSDLDKFMPGLQWVDYCTSPAKRAKIRENIPQLILASYDIVKNDCAVFVKTKSGRTATPTPGPLLDVLEGKRVLVIYDEITRIANRTSNNYKAHKLLVETLRRTKGFRLLVLTATPNERDTMSSFNLGRIIYPQAMPTVAEFEKRYVSKWDFYNNPAGYHNLTAEDCDPGVTPFNELLAPIVIRKRKDDPDVAPYFPAQFFVPPQFVDLNPIQEEFYEAIREMANDSDQSESGSYFSTLRLIAGYPEALAAAEGKKSQEIAQYVTTAGLAKMGSAKSHKMLTLMDKVVNQQGDQAIIFTWFANTVLPLLERDLIEAGYSVSVNRGGSKSAEKKTAMQAFKAGDTQILLSSDAGSKGINLPNAGYVLHYEVSPSFTTFIQRSNRNHRIGQEKSAFVYQFVAAGTVEEGLNQLNLDRNDQSDKLYDNDAEGNFLTAERRREMFKICKKLQKK